MTPVVFRPIAAILALAWFGVAGAPAGAADEKMPNCFCLRHQATGSIAYFGCVSRIAGHGVTPEVKCVGADGKTRRRIESMDGLEKIEDGAPDCKPCVPEFISIRGQTTETIRGDGKKSSQ